MHLLTSPMVGVSGSAYRDVSRVGEPLFDEPAHRQYEGIGTRGADRVHRRGQPMLGRPQAAQGPERRGR